MRDKALNSARTSLTVLGLLLLVVFGVIAAGQARDMKLAGAVQHKFVSTKNGVLGFLGVGSGAQPVTAAALEVKPTDSSATSSTTKPSTDKTSPSDAASKSQSSNINGVANSSAHANINSTKTTVNKVTEDVSKSVQKTKENADDLMRIWP